MGDAGALAVCRCLSRAPQLTSKRKLVRFLEKERAERDALLLERALGRTQLASLSLMPRSWTGETAMQVPLLEFVVLCIRFWRRVRSCWTGDT